MNIRNIEEPHVSSVGQADGKLNIGQRIIRKINHILSPAKCFLNQIVEDIYISYGKYRNGSEDREFERIYYSKSIDSADGVPGIVCLFDGRVFHGGPTDRIRGILSVYKEAKRRNIPFYIRWTHPFDLEEYLIPADYDWRIEENSISYSRPDTFPVIIQDLSDFYSKLKLGAALHYPARQWHVYSNSDDAKGEYRELFNELFKPSEKLGKEIDTHLAFLGSSYVAYTFRFLQLLGDFDDWSQMVLSKEDSIALMNKVKEELLILIREVPEDWKILITSDSGRFLDFIKDADPRIYIVPGDVKNIDLAQGRHEGAWLKTFVDQQLLMRARCVTLMRTGEMYKSGFPGFAAEVGGAKFVDHLF